MMEGFPLMVDNVRHAKVRHFNCENYVHYTLLHKHMLRERSELTSVVSRLYINDAKAILSSNHHLLLMGRSAISVFIPVRDCVSTFWGIIPYCISIHTANDACLALFPKV